jgi:hypothetical protein
MRVAIFTDNDFAKINGVTTTLKAVLRFAGEAIEPRVYTAADVGVDSPSYYAAASAGVGLPWYRDMRVYWPKLGVFARELRRQKVSLVHVTTPGPVGLAAHLACESAASSGRGELPHRARRLRRAPQRIDATRRSRGALRALVLPVMRSAARAFRSHA